MKTMSTRKVHLVTCTRHGREHVIWVRSNRADARALSESMNAHAAKKKTGRRYFVESCVINEG